MRHMTFGIIVLTVAALCGHTRADFVGLTVVREFPNQQTSGGIRDVFRVYAEFTDPNDRVDTWYGTQDNPFVIQNVLADGSPGSGFFQHGGPGSYPFRPEVPGSPYDWSTWATIGETYEGEGGGPTFLNASFGFPQFINGNSLTANASVFLSNDQAPQGLGSFRIIGQDTALRVLLMQLTVLPGEHIQGTISVGGHVITSNGYSAFVAPVQTFSSIPSAGAAAMTILGLLGSRRRCRHTGNHPASF